MYLCDCSGRRVCGNDARVKSYFSGVHIACFAAAANVTEAQGGQIDPGVPALGVGKAGERESALANDAGRIAFLLTWSVPLQEMEGHQHF